MTGMEQALIARIRRKLGPELRIDRLAGDASDRSFFRLSGQNGEESRILMVESDRFDPVTSPFCRMQDLLAGIGLRVPSIVRLYPDEGWVVMADVGRTTLQEHLEAEGLTTIHDAYRQAVDMLLVLQRRGTPALPPDSPGARVRLDGDHLAAELRHTWTHLLAGLWQISLTPQEATLMEDWSDQLGTRLEKTDQVLCHRDFHSRNLMWDGRRLAVVDFQDARLGPVTYDLASLLADPYVEVGEDLKEEIFWRFLEGAGYAREREGELRDWLDLAVVQRCLKAAGTYAFQTAAKHRTGYRKYIGPALRNALQALRRFSEYDTQCRLLERHAAAAGVT